MRNPTVARAKRRLQPAHSGTKAAHVPTSTFSEDRHARGMVNPTGQNIAAGRLAILAWHHWLLSQQVMRRRRMLAQNC